jgi:hypothetical protein
VDDNSVTTIRVFTAVAARTRYAVWKELRWVWDKEKATQYLYGQLEIPPVVGVELIVHERRVVLPQKKVIKYEQTVRDICDAAEQHRHSLVLTEEFEHCVGQLIHAADIYIEMWRFFMEMLGRVSSNRLESHMRLGRAARHLLREMSRVMSTGRGRPSTPYTPAPGTDGLPVWLTWSDASRNTKTFFGAAGAFFHLWGSEDVYFVAEQWPEWLVMTADITQLEMQAADIAAEMCRRVAEGTRQTAIAAGREPSSYLIQIGDSQSVFRTVLNTFRARSPGMRPLVADRWAVEKQQDRLVCGVWTERLNNAAADSLANLDLLKFVEHMRRRYTSDLRLCRLSVPPDVLISDALRIAVRRGGSQEK